MKLTVNFVIVGCGLISRLHLAAIEAIDDARLAGVYDADPQAAAREGDAMVLECRSLDTAHTFCWKLIPSGNGLQLRLTSPLDVIGVSSVWEAHP